MLNDPQQPRPPKPTVLEQATLLTSQGFRVLPVINSQPRKGAGGFGLDAPNYSIPPVLEWWNLPGTEVGILCGPCAAMGAGGDQLLCIDVDGDPATHPVMAAFLATLPPTLASRRGRHLWFRVPAASAARLKTSWDFFKRPGIKHDGLDLKYNGGYARESWDWAPGTDVTALVAAITTLPNVAIDALVAARPAPVLAVPSAPDGNGDAFLLANGYDPVTVRADAVAWLTKDAPLPEPDAGSKVMLIVTGALMVGFGLDDETTLQLLVDVYAPRAWPEDVAKGDIDIEGFEHKIASIESEGSRRWESLELARQAEKRRWLERTVKAGMALTRPDAITAALAALPVLAAGDDEDDEGGGSPSAVERMKAIENRLTTLNYRLQRNQKGDLKNTAFNTAIVLDLHPVWSGMFGYDEFTHNVVFLRDVIGAPEFRGVTAGTVFNEDHHATALQTWFGSPAAGYHEPNKASLIDSVHMISKERRFHAVRAYLDKVREQGWDGVDRNLVNYLGAEPTPYHRAVCAKWLRSAVARALVPGCQADNMLILEGNQGLRKSSVLKNLCPDVRWFYAAASRMVGSKDFMQDMNGKWICEIPEVDQLISSRDESELKALLTRTTDNYRPSYARKSADFDRQLVLSGTTNKSDYLRDPTGNRRYWAVACGLIDDAAVCRDRDQIWAQALHEYEAGQQWWLSPEEVVLAEDEQEARLEGDPWTEHLAKWLAERGDPPEPFTAHEALSGLPGAKPVADQTQADLNRMGKVLRKMGLVQRRLRVGGDRRCLWRRP